LLELAEKVSVLILGWAGDDWSVMFVCLFSWLADFDILLAVGWTGDMFVENPCWYFAWFHSWFWSKTSCGMPLNLVVFFKFAAFHFFFVVL
jgi:hypothetical protein